MKPGIYADRAELDVAVAAHWGEHAYRFGKWQFLPESGEVVWPDGSARLSEAQAEALFALIRRYPAPLTQKQLAREMKGWSPASIKVIVLRIRSALGSQIVETTNRGYRFNPEAVMR